MRTKWHLLQQLKRIGSPQPPEGGGALISKLGGAGIDLHRDQVALRVRVCRRALLHFV